MIPRTSNGMSTLPLNPDPCDLGAVEFGSAPLDREVSLMRVGRAEGGRLMFLGETPAMEHRTARFCQWTDKAGKEHRSAWWEVRVSVPSSSRDVQPGHSLVLVEFPWSRAQVDVAVFKRPSKKGGDQRPQPPERTLADEAALLDWIAARPNNFWEKGNHLTAAISRPTPLQDGSAALRASREALLVFGVCMEDVQRCVSELCQSQQALDLQRRLQHDSLDFWARNAVSGMQKLPKGAYPEVKDMASMLMFLAAKLALAGPVKNSDQWTHRPVMEMVDVVFRNLVNLHNRRAHSRLTREEPMGADHAADDAGGQSGLDWELE